MLHKDRRARIRHERVGKRRPWVDEQREGEGESDSRRDESSSRHVEAVSDDGNHRDEGYSHEVEVVLDRNIRQRVDSRHLDGRAVAIENDSGHCVGLRLESVQSERI